MRVREHCYDPFCCCVEFCVCVRFEESGREVYKERTLVGLMYWKRIKGVDRSGEVGPMINGTPLAVRLTYLGWVKKLRLLGPTCCFFFHYENK
jgi:hypothetical protein